MPPPKRKRTKLEEARHYLSGGGVLREDSDDELGIEDHPWEWIYSTSNTRSDDATGAREIIGARMGTFQCHLGDAVLLKAPTNNEAWVAILHSFSEERVTDEDGETAIEKRAKMLWLSSEKEMRNTKRKRMDFLPNELYVTADFDENALSTINGKAVLLSREAFERRYPSGKVPRGVKEYGKVFVLRRGVNTRAARYTEEFKWEEVYRGRQDLDALVERVERETANTRKRKAVKEADLDDFVLGDEEVDADPSTPSRTKRRKITSNTATPSKARQTAPRTLATPSGRKIVTKRPLEFTPLGTRILSPSHFTSPYARARTNLHVSAVPNALPCREAEFEEVSSYLSAAITAGTGACIYISGTPGTGKTATVRAVVASLQAAVMEEELDDFAFVEINGMKVTDPHQSYSLLWEALKGTRVSSAHALELLDREFSAARPGRVPCVVLMDELDQLVTRNQGVMYNFFNWPQLRHSRLIVLAVANTMDLPERTLSNKISSRLGLTRITFPGYTHGQLMRIIESRLEGVGVSGGKDVIVESDAIQFASRKVAAVSGDARRALDICRRAVEIAELESQEEVSPPDGKENEAPAPDTPSKTPGRQNLGNAVSLTGKSKNKGIVTIATIKRAIAEATSTPLAAYLRALSLPGKVLLAALLARLRRTGIAEAVLADLVDEARLLAMSSQNRDVMSYVLTPPRSPQQAEVDTTLFENAPTTPSKRGRPAAKKSDRKDAVARVVGLGAAAAELVDAGVIGLERGHGERVGRVRLGVSEEDVRAALKEDVECAGFGFGS